MEIPTRFDWDIYKAESNFAKHGVRFSFATRVFLDPNATSEPSMRAEDGEVRLKALGMIDGKLHAVIYCMVGPDCRIISARRTNVSEDRIYASR